MAENERGRARTNVGTDDRNVAELKGERPSQIKEQRGTALHHQIYLIMRDRLLNGRYAPGEMLPSEGEMGLLFGVSRLTMRAAMVTLEAERLIERRRGVGTFVARHLRSTKIETPMLDLLNRFGSMERITSEKLIELEYIRAPSFIQAAFKCDEQDLFQRTIGIQSTKRTPIFHVTTFLPHHIARHFNFEQQAETSLYQLLLQRDILIALEAQAISAQLAGPLEAHLLQLQVGDPLLTLRRRYVDQSGQTVAHVDILAAAAQFEVQLPSDSNWPILDKQ